VGAQELTLGAGPSSPCGLRRVNRGLVPFDYAQDSAPKACPLGTGKHCAPVFGDKAFFLAAGALDVWPDDDEALVEAVQRSGALEGAEKNCLRRLASDPRPKVALRLFLFIFIVLLLVSWYNIISINGAYSHVSQEYSL